MKEAIFPLVGTAFVIVVVLPLCALISKLALHFLERSGSHGPLHGLHARYVLLIGSSIFPVAWFLSAGLHQAESGDSALHCLFDDGPAALCFESIYFFLALSCFVLFRGLAHVKVALAFPTTAHSVQHERRIATVVAQNPHLHSLSHRILVTDDVAMSVGTFGFFRRFVVVSTRFLEKSSDDMLAGALAHEAQHLRSYDPLRYALLEVAMAINPIGRRFLSRHVAYWIAAREAHCDREAVVLGAEPLPLAEAILCAARPVEAVALGAKDVQTLRFRIQMLLAFSEKKPAHCCHQGRLAFPVAALVLACVLFLPHQTSTEALDMIHRGAEGALSHLWN